MLTAAPPAPTAAPARFKPLQNGAVLCWWGGAERRHRPHRVSNPFKTGRYCAGRAYAAAGYDPASVSNPFKTGRYCAGSACLHRHVGHRRVSNPFKTGRYCAVGGVVLKGATAPPFQTPSKRGGTVLLREGDPGLKAPAWFQTPSKRGGTVLHALARAGRRCYDQVSNPFKTGRYCAARQPALSGAAS